MRWLLEKLTLALTQTQTIIRYSKTATYVFSIFCNCSPPHLDAQVKTYHRTDMIPVGMGALEAVILISLGETLQ